MIRSHKRPNMSGMTPNSRIPATTHFPPCRGVSEGSVRIKSEGDRMENMIK